MLTKLWKTYDKDSIFEENLYEIRDEGHCNHQNSERVGFNPVLNKYLETERLKKKQ